MTYLWHEQYILIFLYNNLDFFFVSLNDYGLVEVIELFPELLELLQLRGRTLLGLQ